MTDNPVCPYCHQVSTFLKSSAKVYHGKDYGPIYYCEPCAAWVGCHKGTTKPLGRLANAELRAAKQRAHAAFDPLWRDIWLAMRAGYRERTGKEPVEWYGKGPARKSVYRWLSEELGIDYEDCHIGMFDVAMCEKVIAICTPHLKK